ncbi:MAG: HpcH/HpaI aldolase/citrate lyase family protein [Pseudomonadales bacterium]
MNKIFDNFKANDPSLGLWLNTNDTQIAEITAAAEFDWICIDLQHGLAETGDLKYMLPIIERSGATPIVRLLGAEHDQIGRALDLGAMGVIVPMINTIEDAQMAAAACRYPPIGNRSCGPIRAMAYDPTYISNANSRVACIVMIETAEGLSNVEKIAAIEGVDALFVGPVDLSFAITGSVAGLRTSEFETALQKVVSAAGAVNKPAGIFGMNPQNAIKRIKDGFQFVSVSTDTNLFTAAVKDSLETVKSTL